MTATANSGYNFVNWTANGSVVSTSASYTFTLNSNVTLVANFTPVRNTRLRSAPHPVPAARSAAVAHLQRAVRIR